MIFILSQLVWHSMPVNRRGMSIEGLSYFTRIKKSLICITYRQHKLIG